MLQTETSLATTTQPTTTTVQTSLVTTYLINTTTLLHTLLVPTTVSVMVSPSFTIRPSPAGPTTTIIASPPTSGRDTAEAMLASTTTLAVALELIAIAAIARYLRRRRDQKREAERARFADFWVGLDLRQREGVAVRGDAVELTDFHAR